MKNKQLWQAMLEYLEGQVRIERTPRTATMGPMNLTVCNECHASVPGHEDQTHFAECATGKLIAVIKARLGKEGVDG